MPDPSLSSCLNWFQDFKASSSKHSHPEDPVLLCGRGGARALDLWLPASTPAQARPAERKESLAATNRLKWFSCKAQP